MKNVLLAILLAFVGTSLLGQTIPTPTQTDEIIIDNGQSGKADPGDRIRYKVTIQNTGGPDATNTQLNIVPDPRTTFVPGSFRSSPLAVPDSYACTGNVGISVPAASGLKTNDFDDNIGGATITAGTFATTQSGSITIAADGSFSYTPPVNFTGTDTYTYTLNDGNGVGGGVPATDMATVSIMVSNLIWFIDNSSVAATQDGRLNTPFKSLASFGASALPAAGQVIFLKNTGTEYRGGFILKNNQYLFGTGHSGGTNLADAGVLPFTVAPNSFTLPAIGGTRPLIRNMGMGGSGTGIGIALASGNTIRGVEVGRCDVVKISGTNFGTLTLGNTTNPDVALSGNVHTLNLNTGTFAATSKLASINSPDSSSLILNTVSGSLASASTTLSAYGSGGSITISIQNSSAALDFGNTTVDNKNSQTCISITNSPTGSVTFSNLSMPNVVNGTGLVANSGGTINIGGASSAITARLALDITSTSFGSGATFATITSTSSSGKGVNLDNVAGPVVINGGNISNPAGIAFDLNAGSSTVTYAGTISNANRAVEVTGRTGGTVTFSGNITNTGTGINVASNTGGTIAFSGSSKSLSTGANAAVTLATNTGATINFTGGGLVINTTSGTGFSATGGATAVNVTGSGNTINSGMGTALNVNGTTIGASNLNFQSISHNGGTNGIVLNNTGTSGGLTVTGTGSAGSGGTIQNATIGISLTSTRNVSLTRMQLNNFSDYAIRGTSVVNFTLDNTVVNGTNGNNAAADEGSVRFTELTGSATISNCNISGGFEDNFQLDNSTGTLNRITFSNTTIGANSTTDGNDGITLEATNSAVVNVTVQNSFFTSSRGDLFQLNLLGNSISDLIFTGNTLSNNHPAIATGGGGVTISGGDNTGTGVTLTFNISNNTFRDADGHGLLIVKSTDPGSFSGTFNNNQIGVAATANSGSKAGSGIKFQNAGLGNVTVAVTNNQIRQYNNFGIELLTGGGATPLSGNLHATITGNTVSNPGTGGLPMNGIHLNGGTVPGDTYFICTHISGNTITGSGANGGTDFRLRQRQATTVRLPGYGGANNNDAAVVAFVSGNNSGASGLASNTVPTGGGFVGGAACNLP